MQNTTLYLIRHSIKYDIKDIVENYNTSDSEQIKNEKLILSIEGERRAEILSNEKELQNIDIVYASVLVRTLETAKYLLEKQNLKINLDNRLDERRRGRPNDDIYPDWFTKQFLDENYKTEFGESQKEVRERTFNALMNVLKNDDKKIAIVFHSTAMLFLIMTWCKVVTDKDKYNIIFNNNIVFCGKYFDYCEIFKLTFDDAKLIDIKKI